MKPARLTFAVVLALTLAACAGDSTDNTVVADGGSDVTTTVALDSAPPRGTPLAAGVDTIAALSPPESGAGEVPLFRWQAFAGAATYDLAILAPTGPLWAWSGAETEIRLGGLPFDRPPSVAGPVLAAGSCWSVVARDADGHVLAASEFIPVSPGEPTGHSCEPGALP